MQTGVIISVLNVLDLRGQPQPCAMHILFALLLIRLNEVRPPDLFLEEVSNYKLKEFKYNAIFRCRPNAKSSTGAVDVPVSARPPSMTFK